MTDQEAAEALAGTFQEALREAWGEPDGRLHYDARFDSGPRVQNAGIWHKKEARPTGARLFLHIYDQAHMNMHRRIGRKMAGT